VSVNFGEVFGVQPVIGRGFVHEDGTPGSSPVMLVSYPFWQQYLSADLNMSERAVFVDEVPYTVVGVMPRSFRRRSSGRALSSGRRTRTADRDSASGNSGLRSWPDWRRASLRRRPNKRFEQSRQASPFPLPVPLVCSRWCGYEMRSLAIGRMHSHYCCSRRLP
jgi:hypothetical protein